LLRNRGFLKKTGAGGKSQGDGTYFDGRKTGACALKNARTS